MAFAALILGAFVITGCSNEENDVSNTSYVKKETQFDNRQRILNDEQIRLIGIEHNNYLYDLLQLSEENPTSNIDELKSIVEEKYSTSNEFTDSANLIIDNSINLALEDLFLVIDKNPILTNNPNALKDLLRRTAELADNYTDNARFLSDINQLKTEANNSLVGIDLDTYLIFSSVFENSTDFWFNSGNYDNITTPMATRSQVAKADGISAAIGFLTLAAVTSALVIAAGSGGLATPAIYIVVELLGIGFSSALSSATVILGL